MKKIIIACDGTWNSPDSPSPTNVIKIACRIAKRDGAGVPQIVFYDQGVGTGNALDKLSGGAFGSGIEDNIHDAYIFLIANFEAGDELYFLGFSRGAFTARSIMGMVRKCGILGRHAVARYEEAVALYRSEVHPNDAAAVTFRHETSVVADGPIEIKFVGVWDTVGALGIPIRGLRSFQRHQYEFHDTELSGDVRYAYHALAIDEERGPFEPTLWDFKPKADQVIEQTWFAGVHSDDGGGYPSAGLSDIALSWMIGKASQPGLLAIDADAIDARPLHPDALGVLHNSRTLFYDLIPSYERPVGMPSKASTNAAPNGTDPTQSLDASVLERWDADPTYRPAGLSKYLQLIGDARSSS
jgi:uncharacterized protein (DUF2235 family)